MRAALKAIAVVFAIAAMVALFMSYRAHARVTQQQARADAFEHEGGRLLAELAVRNHVAQRTLTGAVGVGALLMGAITAWVAFRDSAAS